MRLTEPHRPLTHEGSSFYSFPSGYRHGLNSADDVFDMPAASSTQRLGPALERAVAAAGGSLTGALRRMFGWPYLRWAAPTFYRVSRTFTEFCASRRLSRKERRVLRTRRST